MESVSMFVFGCTRATKFQRTALYQSSEISLIADCTFLMLTVKSEKNDPPPKKSSPVTVRAEYWHLRDFFVF